MLPTLFQIGPIPVRSFGVMVLAGFLLGLAYALRRVRGGWAGRGPGEPGAITREHVFDMSLGGLFVCIVGARLLFIALDWRQFSGRPLDLFKVWSGGISIIGAIIAGSLYLWWYCRRHGLQFLEFADLAAPAFALGYAVGRIGCFLNGCCYGHPCDLPWAVRFPSEAVPGTLTPPSHPAQLYATLMGLAIFGILDRWTRRPRQSGEAFLGFLGLYALYRFIDEIFRKGATAQVLVAGLTHAQVLSLVVLPIVLFLLVRLRRSPRRPQAGEMASTPQR